VYELIKQKITALIPEKKPQWLIKSAPWLIGSGIALSHIATTTNCTIPQQGRCSTCGSCVVAIGALVTWAIMKKPKDGDLYQKR